jgi:regulator of PEP synthase PpsR (kinase-PPPase family)
MVAAGGDHANPGRPAMAEETPTNESAGEPAGESGRVPTQKTTNDSTTEPPPDSIPAKIYIVSDGRGNTALQLVKAALVQFPEESYEIIRKSDVLEPAQVSEAISEAHETDGIVFYTLVAQATREAMEHGHRDHGVPIVDLLGTSLHALGEFFISAPHGEPGLYYASDRDRFDRVEAVNFAMTHDDGQRPHELAQADVVLVGVSRSSKSSTCLYLAMLGVKAANVPLVPQLPIPRELVGLDPRRVIGLTIGPLQLRAIRLHRAEMMKLRDDDPYVDKRAVAQEIRHANRVMEERGWRTIHVGYRAIEETAREVVRVIRFRPERYGAWGSGAAPG